MGLNWLLVFIPIALGLDWFGANPLLVFLTAALAIVPMAALMGDATEALAHDLGPTLGGLLNATLGNAPELIIATFALRAGLVDIVKSSLTGSILGNLLFGLGAAFLVGGLKHRRWQQFDPKSTRITTALLTLVSLGLIIPAVSQFSTSAARSISRETAAVLFVVYLGSLVAIFVNRQPLIGKDGVKASLKEQDERPDEVEGPDEPRWSRRKSVTVLTVVTLGLAVMSEILTGALQPASQGLHLTPEFTGVFLLALVGNAAELFTAIRFARKDQMDICIGITTGASVQVGLLVAPVLVFVGALLGKDMNLIFTPLELVALVMAIYLTRNLTYDGESSWLEGLMLIGLYVLLGAAFFYIPEVAPPAAAARP
jgi:Ca2+:H+ antiporter